MHGPGQNQGLTDVVFCVPRAENYEMGFGKLKILLLSYLLYQVDAVRT